MVSLHDVHKRYAEIAAVDGVSFSLRTGEIFGLLGPNGAGKTTIINMLAGIQEPTEGEILVEGRVARRSDVAIRRGLGLVPQELAIYFKLTARENLAFFGSLYGLRGAALKTRIDEMLDLVGLTDRASSLVSGYSGGMKRRLNLAVGLMHNPRLLLLDEPTVGVDPHSRNHIFEGVRELNRAGLTVLYTSHYMEEAQSLCDRVGIMDRGRMVACDTVDNLISGLGGATVEARLSATPEEAALGRMREMEGILSLEWLPATPTNPPQTAEIEAGTLRARANRPELVLASLVAALTAESLSLQTLAVRQPDLEDVFLAITGKHLRD